MAQSVNEAASSGAHTSGGGGDSTPPAGIGHNGPDEACFRRHLLKILAANQEMDEARAKRSAIRKAAKFEGIELKKLDAMITMMEWEPGEVRDHFKTLHLYATWSHLPLYTQGDMFAEPPQAALPALDWYAKGFIASTTKRGAYGEAPDDCPAASLQDYLKGVADGTTANAAAMKAKRPPKPKEVEKPAAAEAKTDEPDLDPKTINRQARKLRESGFTEPAAKVDGPALSVVQ